MTIRISSRVVPFSVLTAAAVAVGLAACGGGDGANEVTGQPQDAGVPTAEAEHAANLQEAAQIGEEREIRFHPRDTAGSDLDATIPLRVTVTRFAKGSPPCGPDDEILSVCDGSVAPIHIEMQVDNANDVPVRVPKATVLRPEGEGLTLYVCPGFDELDELMVGSELPPKTTATVTVCFGSASPVSSLSGWSVRVSAFLGLPADGSGEALWIRS